MQNIDTSLFWGNQTGKGLLAYLLAILMSLVFSLIFNAIYQLYSSRTATESSVNRSFVLIAPSVTAIFLVIQFSLPLSLGLLGALSFVRFRTPVKEAEDIGFILLVIATSLSCAVFRFEVGVLLIAVLALVTVIKTKGGPISTLFTNRRTCDFFLSSNNPTVNPDVLVGEVKSTFEKEKLSSEIVSISTAEGQTSLHVRVRETRKRLLNLTEAIKSLRSLASISHVNVVFSQT